MGLELRLRGDGFGFYDLDNNKWLETPAEAAENRAEAAENRAEAAENRAEQETTARLHAEAELTRLREEIERLKSQSNS